MGLEDRDWYREAYREREKKRERDERRAKSPLYQAKKLGVKVLSPTKAGLIPMIIFWTTVMSLLYGGMSHYLKPKQAKVTSNGDLVINRGSDGHFYTTGNINGNEAVFLVDTGASFVTVNEQFAQKAMISGGVSTNFVTANGILPGRVVEGVGVSIGPITVTNVKVGVGLRLKDENVALLGQSFLSKFDVLITNNQMVLKPR